MTEPLRIVLLRHPAPGDRLLSRVLAMRERGYREWHGDAEVSADRYDAVSTHVLVCGEDAAGLRPWMAFRATAAGACAAAGLPFPLAPVLAHPATRAHARALAEEMDACRRARRELTYLGLWTTDPEMRARRPLQRDVLRLMGTLLVGVVRDEGFGQLVAAAVEGVRSEQLLARYGMRAVERDGGRLPPIDVPHIEGETASLIRMEAFTDEALREAEAWRTVWERRLVLEPAGARSAA